MSFAIDTRDMRRHVKERNTTTYNDVKSDTKRHKRHITTCDERTTQTTTDDDTRDERTTYNDVKSDTKRHKKT